MLPQFLKERIPFFKTGKLVRPGENATISAYHAKIDSIISLLPRTFYPRTVPKAVAKTLTEMQLLFLPPNFVFTQMAKLNGKLRKFILESDACKQRGLIVCIPEEKCELYSQTAMNILAFAQDLTITLRNLNETKPSMKNFDFFLFQILWLRQDHHTVLCVDQRTISFIINDGHSIGELFLRPGQASQRVCEEEFAGEVLGLSPTFFVFISEVKSFNSLKLRYFFHSMGESSGNSSDECTQESDSAKYLQVPNSYQERMLGLFSDFCSRLKSLHLDYCHFDSTDHAAIPSHFSSIENLTITNCKFTTRQLFYTLPKSLKHIKITDTCMNKSAKDFDEYYSDHLTLDQLHRVVFGSKRCDLDTISMRRFKSVEVYVNLHKLVFGDTLIAMTASVLLEPFIKDAHSVTLVDYDTIFSPNSFAKILKLLSAYKEREGNTKRQIDIRICKFRIKQSRFFNSIEDSLMEGFKQVQLICSKYKSDQGGFSLSVSQDQGEPIRIIFVASEYSSRLVFYQ
ncbi:hypothetical protein FGO68_gene2127 [Halteria grandinella]|uniref:Uncharacterized protein n=1 Tax=Halteria grandinella TaxID=5974 RepID=A0A8J8NTY9_HALGN|nr:hypothetical protein FGO68_gene2127 [Halteria grandinella]